MGAPEFELLSSRTTGDAARLLMALWPYSTYGEEYDNCCRILNSDKETIQLAKVSGSYVGVIYLCMRYDYVEGTSGPPVVYIEGIYVKPEYRKLGIGFKLADYGEQWGRSHGATAYASDSILTNEVGIEFHLRSGFREVNRVVCFAKSLPRGKDPT
jgi:aminoglycoside 6'-N-acetyltransferase I